MAHQCAGKAVACAGRVLNFRCRISGQNEIGSVERLVGTFDNFERELNAQQIAMADVALKIARLSLTRIPSTVTLDYVRVEGGEIELTVNGISILSANAPPLRVRLEFGQPDDCLDDVVTATSDNFMFQPRPGLNDGQQALADAFLSDLNDRSLRYYYFIHYPIVPGPVVVDGPDVRFQNDRNRSLFYLQVVN